MNSLLLFLYTTYFFTYLLYIFRLPKREPESNATLLHIEGTPYHGERAGKVGTSNTSETLKLIFSYKMQYVHN